ncbi:MAG: HEPN domain-containing protein, partial [Chloroflexi bacterium]|nr:HEPN domain-containing protein [Chloroflexota bacterium]
MRDERGDFLSKAREALRGAELELSARCFNNAANRAYYACFFAAIVALLNAGIRPYGKQWGHEFVQAQFSGVLIRKRKLYSVELRDVLTKNIQSRTLADYDSISVTE